MTENDDNQDLGQTGPEGQGPDPKTEEAPTRQIPSGDGAREGAATKAGTRKLMRSRDDRVIGGVAGGLGRYFDVDPVIFRIGFAVSILFGGLGIIAYIAAALFVPNDDGTGVAVPAGSGHGVLRALGVVVLVLAGLAGFTMLAAGAAFVTGLGYGLTVVAAIVLIGVALVALSFRGSGGKWLIVPALALTIGAGAAAAADLDLEGGVGVRNYRPASASAIPANGYRLGVGRMAIDLRDIDWSPERVLDLNVDQGIGETVIAVPANVCVAASAHARAGNLRIAGEQVDGMDVEATTADGSQATPRLVLDADIDLGEIRVINDDDAEIDNDHGGPFGGSRGIAGAALRDANAKACSG